MALTPQDFTEFFEAIHNAPNTPSERRKGPFPWQQMLVERVLAEGWPHGIDLPTASGKTACLDVAVFTLACRAAETEDCGARPALPRRIFFVVDRRIVVDEAHRRAQQLAYALQDPENEVLREVRRQLLRLADLLPGEAPLVVSRMRGGVRRDDEWLLNPAVPAIVTSTVDQIGSRMLFRGYGVGKLTAPIHAALTACDSLVLLDEAHCSVPFAQTLRWIRRYSGNDWRAQAVVEPVQTSVLSATLPDEITDVFPPEDHRKAALDHPLLDARFSATKVAQLAIAKKPGKRDWQLGHRCSDDDLVLDAASRAAELARNGGARIAVMVNRVATASAIYEQLRNASKLQKNALDAELVFLTGRMRPIDREAVTARWSTHLRATGPEPLLLRGRQVPIIVVTTQCLEVGADFSFDVLVTECASLDALRQRFGRVNRLGGPVRGQNGEAVKSVVLIRKNDVKENEKLDDAKPQDPIYGNAIARTWNWLGGPGEFKFGIYAVDLEMARRPVPLADVNAPTSDAPVMMPGHVDLWCQTAPRPSLEPDISTFLHGPNRGLPEAEIVFRRDLDESDPAEGWLDSVSALPPLAVEGLTVPLHVLRRWLRGENVTADKSLADVEGQRWEASNEGEQGGGEIHNFLIWRGRRRSTVASDPEEIRPGDRVVVAATDSAWIDQLGHYFNRPDGSPVDVAESAWWNSRRKAVLRVSERSLGWWSSNDVIASLIRWATSASDEDPGSRDESELRQLLTLLAERCDDDDLPTWLREVAAPLSQQHLMRPIGDLAIVLVSAGEVSPEPSDEFADEDDSRSSASRPIGLRHHCSDVRDSARKFARACLSDELAEEVGLSGQLHDLGKADPRFQAMLRGLPIMPRNAELLAKSDRLGMTKAERDRIRRQAGLPAGFRHEMFSVELALREDALPQDALRQELVLHLVGSHHGYGRPFAPVCLDSERESAGAAHDLASGIADRFWRLTRRYGWWGLAYLEAILRLADWHASAHPSAVPVRAKPAEELAHEAR